MSLLAGIDVQAQVSYTQAFTTNEASWTGNFTYFTGTTACGGSGGAMQRNLYNLATTGNLVSPLLGVSNGTLHTLTFDYKVANWSANTVGTPANFGSFNVQWSATGAAPWTTFGTVNSTNHTVSGSCASKTFTFTPPNGSNVYIRFNASWSNGDYYLNFDNVSLQGIATLPPSCATAVLPANGATNVARNPAFSWTAATGGATSYDIYLGTANPAPLVANVSGTTYTHSSGLLANTLYYYKVVAKNAVGDAVGCVQQSFTTGASLNYCLPVTDYGCGDGDVIARVILNTLDNNSGTGCPSDPVPGNQGIGQNGPGYSDYSSNPALTTTLQAGSVYSCTVYAGQYGEGYAAWIDYNDNGIFETSERIGFSVGQVAGSGTAGVLGSSASFPIVLACNPPLGQHRLRVRAMYNTNGSAVTACGNNSYGEIEDYTITISAAAACPQPSGLTATATSTTGGTLSWTVGCAETAWQVAVQAAGSGTPTGAGVPVSGTPTYTVSGLTPGSYEYYVRADCSGDGFSVWTGPYMFTPPLCPTLISPANGATNVAIPGGGVPLTWSAVSGATTYDVYFGQTAGATVLLGSIAATTVNITGVANGSTNFWKIIAKNANGDSVGCTEFSFTTVSCGPAALPYTQGFETIAFANALADCVTSTPVPASGGKVQTFIADASATNSALTARTGSKFAAVYWSPQAKGTIYSPALQLTAGVSYRATVYYKTDGIAWPTVGLYYGTANNEASMTNVIASVTNATATSYTAIVGDFIAPSTGTFYVAMQADNTTSISPNYCAFDDFTVEVSPTTITSFTPAAICASGGQTVTINGAQFNGATAVQFNGVNATSYTIVSNNVITAVAPAGLSTGNITVTSPNGTGTSATTLTVNENPTVEPITAPGGATNICLPDSLTLSDATPTGSWSSSNLDVATVNASGVVSSVAVGSTLITYTVTDGITGCSSSQTYALTVSEPVSIVSSTPSQSVVTNGNTSFNVVATGTGNPTLTYQWYEDPTGTADPGSFVAINDGGIYSGATTATLQLTGVPAEYLGYFYYATVTGICNSADSSPAILLVGDTGIETNPQDASVCTSGAGTASFSVVASSDVTSYQWQEDQGGDNWMDLSNGGMYAGVDTPTLSLSGITFANNGWRYKCIVIGIGAAESTPATLSVVQSVAVNTDPSPQTVCYSGGSATFNVAATGGVSSYTWQYFNGATWDAVSNGVPAGTTYTGSATASLNVTTTAATPASGTYLYRAMVNANAGCPSVTSASAQLFINTPAITAQPSATSVVAGGSTSLTVSTSAPSPTFQWEYATAVGGPYAAVVNATPAGVTYTGATTATLNIATTTAVVASTARYYRVVVSSPAGCSVATTPAQLTIINYCTTSYANGTGSGDYISLVNIPTTTLNNSSAGAPSPYYTLYPQTGSTTASLFKGSTYTLSVRGGTFSTCYISAWADYNNDGVFAAAEFIGVSPNCGSSTTVNLTTNWLIPLTATSGSVRLRLRSSDTSPGPSAGQACGATNSGWGEAEDYIITLVTPPACSGTPTAGTVTSSVANVCVSGTATLTVTGYQTGATGLSYQWYNSSGPIASATGFTYTTPVLSAPESYYFRVTCANGGASSDSNTIVIGVNNPMVTGTTPATRCGTGTVNLAAAGSAGTTLNWFAAATGGLPLGTGSPFTTPTISANTTYYVAASIGGSAGSLGPVSPAVGTYGSSFTGSYEIFNVTSEVTLVSVDAFPTAAGTVIVELQNASGTVLQTSPTYTVTAAQANTTLSTVGTPVTIPVGFTIPAGNNYRLNFKSTSTASLVRNSGGAAATYGPTLGVTITGNSNATVGYYYNFYKWSLSNGCFSARTPVVATVNTPPALTLSSNAATICAGASTVTPITVTSTVSDFDTYSWSPSTGVSGNVGSGYTFNPASTTTYTLTASNAVSGCANTATVVVTVNPLPSAVVFAPAALTVCSVGDAALVNVLGVGSGTAGGCLNAPNNQWPTSAFTPPSCNGTANVIATNCYAGEYSVVNVSANTKYTFTSALAGDKVTISDAAGTVVLASALGTATYVSTTAGQVRFYTHLTSTNCGSDSVDRSRIVACEPILGVVFAPTAGLYTDAAATTAYAGGAVLSIYAKPAMTSTYTATRTTGAGCTTTAQLTVTVNQATTWYVDNDADGYGDSALPTVMACSQPTGYAAVGGDCNDAVAAINPGHAEVLYNGVDDNCDGQLDEGNQLVTSLLPASCGTTLTSIGSLVGITTVSSAITGYRIRITNGAQVQVIEKNVPHFTFPEFPSYAYATTYTVEIQLQRNGVWLGYYGPACLVSTPAILEEGGASAVSPSQCGITLPKINTLIATTSLQGVTGYRFQVTNLTDPLGPNAVQTIDRTQNWFSLPMLTRYNYGTTYRIEIAVKTTGAYGGFGAPCEVSSPPAPSLINCGGIAASGTSTVAATSVQGATQYRFQITRQSDLASATIDRNSNYFIFNSVPASAFTPGALYGIRVAVMTSGFWSPFGDACEYTAPGGASKGEGSDAAAVASEFRATAYPNPFTSDFGIDVTSSNPDNVQVRVYDMLGKLIEDRSVRLQDLSLEKVGAQYPSGVYNVIVTQGEIVKTLRVIKR